MKYKVIKQEFLPKRPAWMCRLLVRLQPSLYEKQKTEVRAQAVIRYIRIIINRCKIVGGRLRLSYTPSQIEIKNNFGKTYLSFKIEETK